MKIQIESRFTGSILFEHEEDGNTGRLTLEEAVSARANLAGANLARANLAGANLAGANLEGSNLEGANIENGCALSGLRPVFQIGPIGSRCAYFVAYITNKGLHLRAGCFFGSRDEFEEKLAGEHCDNDHAKEYRAALALIDAHAEIWTPKSEEQKVMP